MVPARPKQTLGSRCETAATVGLEPLPVARRRQEGVAGALPRQRILRCPARPDLLRPGTAEVEPGGTSNREDDVSSRIGGGFAAPPIIRRLRPGATGPSRLGR